MGLALVTITFLLQIFQCNQFVFAISSENLAVEIINMIIIITNVYYANMELIKLRNLDSLLIVSFLQSISFPIMDCQERGKG